MTPLTNLRFDYSILIFKMQLECCEMTLRAQWPIWISPRCKSLCTGSSYRFAYNSKWINLMWNRIQCTFYSIICQCDVYADDRTDQAPKDTQNNSKTHIFVYHWFSFRLQFVFDLTWSLYCESVPFQKYTECWTHFGGNVYDPTLSKRWWIICAG